MSNVEQIQSKFDKALTDLKQLTTSTPTERSPLWVAWHFLQVYSTWGLGLPTERATLNPVLNIVPGVQESFSDQLLLGNQQIKDGCTLFQSKVFPRMIGVATGILNHSELGANDKANMFGTIKAMVGTDKEAAFSLLDVMEESVKENIKKAEGVEDLLGDFSSRLIDARASIEGAATALEADETTSQANIERLNGDENTEGSLAYIQKQLQDKQEDYEQAVTIAATTPTYAWITFPVPVGPVAAIVVASVYGSKATDLSDQIEKCQADFKNATSQFRMAVASQATTRSGAKQIEFSLGLIDRAKEHTTLVKNSWVALQGSLGGLRGLLAATTATGRLEANASYLIDSMGKKWANIYPALLDLTTDPYIDVKPGGQEMQQLAKEVKQYAEAA